MAGGEVQAARALAGQRLVVRDQHQGRGQLAVERQQQLDDARAGGLVEIAGRLVGEQDLRRAANARAIATRCCSPPDSWLG